jgi:uncharacterized repeat protein (TIGR03803 family)
MLAIPTAALSLILIVASGLAVPRPVAAGGYTLTALAFFNGANGTRPAGDVVRDEQGNLFGTTSGGGAFGLGTVWELSAGSNPSAEALEKAGLHSADFWLKSVL